MCRCGRTEPRHRRRRSCRIPAALAVDVLIVGAGYTGLAAARETAAAGQGTLVLDAGAIGAGCSGRNGGQVAYSISRRWRNSPRGMARRAPGRFAARDSMRWATCVRMAASGELDCDWRETGATTARTRRGTLRAWCAMPSISPRGWSRESRWCRARFEHTRDCDRYVSRRLRLPRRCLDRSDAAAARAARPAQAVGAAVLERCPVLSIRARAAASRC